MPVLKRCTMRSPAKSVISVLMLSNHYIVHLGWLVPYLSSECKFNEMHDEHDLASNHALVATLRHFGKASHIGF
jgi:hypothetical protein